MQLAPALQNLSAESLRAYATACFAAGSGGPVQHQEFLALLKLADEKEKLAAPVEEKMTYKIDPIKIIRTVMHEQNVEMPANTSSLYVAKMMVDEICEKYDIVKKAK